MYGYIHSQESFGTVDGPGIRYVLFMQGCPMRCIYCHNPDTWREGGRAVTAEEIIAEYKKNKAFYSKGGITVTGGEPLMQLDFLCELFDAAKRENIHTCIDTSGAGFDGGNAEYMAKIDRLLSKTDLVMLDIKHIDPQKHREITGRDNGEILAFAQHLASKSISVWIRYVVVKGITDGRDDLINLGRYIGKMPNVRALDVLPYHTLGSPKYKELGIPYRLEGVPPLKKSEAAEARALILSGIKSVRESH